MCIWYTSGCTNTKCILLKYIPWATHAQARPNGFMIRNSLLVSICTECIRWIWSTFLAVSLILLSLVFYRQRTSYTYMHHIISLYVCRIIQNVSDERAPDSILSAASVGNRIVIVAKWHTHIAHTTHSARSLDALRLLQCALFSFRLSA